jgi:N-acetyl-gamma-glutamyl-phosphate reductase
MISTVILGVAGYTGQETLDRVLAHPELELLALGSDSQAGKAATVLDPRLRRNGKLPALVTNDEALGAGAQLILSCLPNERAAALDVPADATVIDMSGAHRLQDTSLYAEWYGFEHPRPETQGEWCYGLPELQPPTTRLIANPGCYVTAALLALAPLKDVVDRTSVVVDGKSGVTGAGGTPSARTIAGTVLDNVSPYKVGRHQHVPEMAQMLGFAPTFIPHVLPIKRGLIVTCVVDVQEGADARALLEDAYAGSAVVSVLPEGETPEIARVVLTDAVEIGVFTDRSTGRTIVIAAEDNLGKGAAGQMIQNANRWLGLDETLGLRLHGVTV